jgi:starch synthase
MKVLVMFDYPASPGGLATQGALLYRGLTEMGIEAYPVNYESYQEKEWYYHWFKPDIVVGVGYWGHTPQIILHPQRFGCLAIPWLVADGYVGSYREILDALPLILVTSKWVKKVYKRDGLSGENINVLPVGCDTDSFIPRDKKDPKIVAIRESLGVTPEELMILTVGGDATSKGAQEVMQALAINEPKAPPWKYVCKVWPQPRTETQNLVDMQLAAQLGISKKVVYASNVISRNFMPYLIAACDIYAAPSRLEGFGMTQIEAASCGKPVIGIKAMGMLDTMVHGENAFLASVAQEIRIKEMYLGDYPGDKHAQRVIFKRPRAVDFRASVHDIANYMMDLMESEELRKKMGEAGRKRAIEHFDYKVVTRKFLKIVKDKLGIS